MTEERFELRSWHYHKLQAVIYDNQSEETLELSLFEIVELLNEVSQSEYNLQKLGDEIQEKLDELLKRS